MRILLNGIPVLSPFSGVGNYVRYLGGALTADFPGDDFYYHYMGYWSRHLRQRPSPIYSKAGRFLKRWRQTYRFHRWTLDTAFRLGRRWGRFDLYHETNFIPLPFDGPTVATVFDLSFHHHPETHPAERMECFRRYFYPRLNWAHHFLTISEFVKKEMVRHLSIPAEKITVTPLGVGDEFRPLPAATSASVLADYGLTAGSYVLFVGTLEPRKNLGLLLRAYARLPSSLRAQHPLALAGGAGWLMDHFPGRSGPTGIDQNLRRLGYVRQEHLPALYSGASVFVFPSLYEGFGLPPVEAMACGAPVITSTAASLPEVVGDAAIQFDPQDDEGLARALEEVLTSSARREELCRRGLARARNFRWERTAQMTMDVYRRVAGVSAK